MKKRKIKYTLLSKTIPEYSKRDNTLYTCSVGLSPELGLIRVYPLPLVGMEKWGIYELDVEKNKRDSREESWKISSYSRKEEWNGYEADIKRIGTANKQYVVSCLAYYVDHSISELNRKRKSIGVLDVGSEYNLKWDTNARFVTSNQIGLFQDVEIDLAPHAKFTKATKEKECRLVFNDADGKHNIQYNEWGIYEFQRKFGAKKDAFRYLNGKENQYLLIGNMHNYRNTWIALSIFDKPHQQLLFKTA